ncbi:undecaprenyl-phosphate galactose phosphotransferase WbaP [Synechococcus sp. PCC 7335]|uniref:undecaprenyl-phosphate galactose phosphotransferase WbaP n=1 Tax=Synechococcus sp. (strain ATCC 29403 / PCC 7335) TaxID=91464 RepID=UPI001D0D56BA|nr:undecaprenyl-phosphate galactose phosphotransferase WbaP [Synechococcus sp. PCC 7335]
MSYLSVKSKEDYTAHIRRAIAPVPHFYRFTLAIMVGIDVLCHGLAGFVSVWIQLLNSQFDPLLYWRLWPVIGLFVLAYALAGLYPGIAINPVEELRRLSLTTTLMYLLLGTSIFLSQGVELYGWNIFLSAWLLSLLLVISGRYGARSLCASRSWWRFPVVIMGAGRSGEVVIHMLQQHPSLGLEPVAVLDDDPKKQGYLAGIPVVGPLKIAPIIASDFKIPYAIVAMPGVSYQQLLPLIDRYGKTFPHLIIIPDLFGMAALGIAAKDLGGVLGLEVHQQLFFLGPKLLKAALDKALVVLIGLACLPLIALISLLVFCGSSGPIFYQQTRIGRGGKLFRIWKFRSMVTNADQVLAQYFECHPQLRKAWDQDQKLKDDPRITQIGKFLRRTSLDELPQLWNVLRGEMSMVGPRPIVKDEVWRYGDKFDYYSQVLPGITGLWQVSGRNNLTYAERINLDTYYVRNWSVWLDIYILARTMKVVLAGDGAY